MGFLPARLRRTPPYPSPPASQQHSHSGSPSPDAMDAGAGSDKDGPPTKRRRMTRDPRDRTTEYLDLLSGKVEASQQEELDRLLHVLHKRQKVVVIAGAGMSVSAGIPDFRSSDGLFRTLKEEHKLKGSGKDLFDASVYKDDSTTSMFHSMITSLYRSSKKAKPTAFHHMLATMAKEGRLLRLYSQNVDGLDTGLAPLRSATPFRKDENGSWPKTVQLHGSLEKMVCTKCGEQSEFDVELFEEAGATPPACGLCQGLNDVRTNDGKRSHGIGRLRPRMVLYNEQHPDAEAIGSCTNHDLRRRPDAVIVVGTSVKVPGVRRIVQEMCATVRDRKDGGLAVWINQDLPPKQFDKCFDIIVQSDCDWVANRAAMPKWYETPDSSEDFCEVSEEEAQKAVAQKAEVRLPRKPKCQLTHANLVQLASEEHFNNSFRPPSPGLTPVRDPESLRPVNWSPLTSRKSSIMPTIELDGASEGENITVADGLLTPTKSQKSGSSTSNRSTPAKKMPTFVERLKDANKSKKAGSSGAKILNGFEKQNMKTKQKQKQNNVKYIKASNSKPNQKTTAAAKTKRLSSSGSKMKNSLTNSFSSTKPSSVVAAKNQIGGMKLCGPSLPLSPAKSQSKLRQVSYAPETRLHPVPAQSPRVNTSSPAKKPVAFFPGLVSGVKRKGMED